MALIPDDPKQQKALGAITLALVVLYFGYSLWYSGDAVEAVEADEGRVENLAAQNRTAQALAISAGRGLEDRMILIERHVAELEQLIPSSEEVALVMDQMDQVSRDVGVSVTMTRPEAVVQGEGAVYAQQAFQMTVLGDYHDVGRFLAGIASLPRIITPSDLQLVPYNDPSGTLGFDAPVEVNFRIHTYLAPDRPLEPPPAP